MNLSDLIKELDARAVAGDPASCAISAITEDSRTVTPGALFIARKGATTDGRAFIPAAITAGAAAILTDSDAPVPTPLPSPVVILRSNDPARDGAIIAERFCANPSSSLNLIGVTGTNGKTTVAHLVQQLITATGSRCGLIGTVHIDDGASRRAAAMTTPPAIEISKLLATMRDNNCAAVAMEVSSHALHQRRAAGLRFRTAIFTNLTGDHLDYHGDMTAYADAKALLFESLDDRATAIVNIDDPAAKRMTRNTRAQILTCTSSSGGDAHCRAAAHNPTITGADVTFTGPWGAIESRLPLIGAHNVTNALQAIAAAHVCGADRDQLARAIPNLLPPPGRFEPVRIAPDQPFHVLVDYAHTDDALDKALAALQPLIPAGARLIVCFGCGGDRDRTKRPRMARAAAARANLLVITSDNPRRERPESIIEEVLAGLTPAQRAAALHDPDRARAIETAISLCQPADVLLIAGKGHEDYQILPDGRGGTIRRHFDDREVAAESLRRRLAPSTTMPSGQTPRDGSRSNTRMSPQ
ncbi:MAG: UDP-N-acetylmuramoyl-L-alanyl-D-glutamate--2,6-diaminopimelate ligase [Planctomycetota bacterium]|nr:UDP-N-acetylmuramoyl-L-alanyl-D-glutamate--2,6-diaminopimelate ligase [Planctomycetota bacterium]